MFYMIHKQDIVRLLGANLGMLPRFRIFESKEQKKEEKTEDEPSSKRIKMSGLKNGRRFVVDGKLEQKPSGF